MQIVRVTKNNRYYREIINIYNNWWGKEKGLTYDEINKLYINTLDNDELPKIYALISNDTLIGTYEINEKDGIDSEKYTKYIANVFIKEKYRKNGYSKLLIEDAIERAKYHDYNALYLHSRLENYYEKYGFKLIKEVNTSKGIKRIFELKIKKH